MRRVVFFRCNRPVILDCRGIQANRIGKVQEGWSTHKICSLAGKHAQGFWKEYIVAGSQANATNRGIEGRQSQVAGAGPETVTTRQMKLSVFTIHALGVDQQNRVVICRSVLARVLNPLRNTQYQ